MNFKCTLHGSYQKDLDLIHLVAEYFQLIGVEVLCPKTFDVVKSEDGFVTFKHDSGDPIEIEAQLLQILRENRSNPNFFAYFVNKDGYLGVSASYELAVIQELGVQFYALQQIVGLPFQLAGDKLVRPIDLVRRLLYTPVS